MADFSIGVDHTELFLLWMCTNYLVSRIPEAQKDEAVLSLLKKLDAVREKADSPYDVRLDLTANEVHQVDSALHLMMADATMAKKFGGPADEQIGKTRLSEFAEFVPMMNGILRRLRLNERLVMQEQRIADLQAQLEQIRKEVIG